MNPLSYFLYRLEKKSILNLLSRRTIIQKSGKALDLGTGRGWSLKLIPTEFSSIYAVDQSIKMTQLVKQKYPTVDVTCCNALNTPYSSETIDLIMCVGLSEYIIDIHHLVAEISRLLTKGGFAIITSSPANIFNQMRKLLGHKIYFRSVSTMHEIFKSYEINIIKTNHSPIQDQFLIFKSNV